MTNQDQQKIPPGYKLTEIGVIPQDWAVVRFGDIGESIIGLTYSPNDVVGHGVLVHRSSNVSKDNKLKYDDNVYVSKIIPEKLILQNEDVLICVRNGSRHLIGKSAIIEGKAVGKTFGAFMSVFRSKKGKYIFHLMSSNLILRQIDQSLGATINQITNKTLNGFIVPMPIDTKEQQSIATALTDVDNLISELDILIIKKQAIKHGTMQQLLTGKKRLPGFSGEREEKSLGEICVLQNGYSFKSSTYIESGEFTVITIANVQDGFFYPYNANKIGSLPSDLQKHQKLELGDVLISMTGNVGRVCIVNENNCLLNQRVGKLANITINSKLFYYLLNGKHFLNSMILKAQGGAQGNIGKNDILEYSIFCPMDPKEQEAIAQFLSDMDADIQNTITQRDKYKTLKQGMMQQLLTGKIRLKTTA